MSKQSTNGEPTGQSAPALYLTAVALLSACDDPFRWQWQDETNTAEQATSKAPAGSTALKTSGASSSALATESAPAAPIGSASASPSADAWETSPK